MYFSAAPFVTKSLIMLDDFEHDGHVDWAHIKAPFQRMFPDACSFTCDCDGRLLNDKRID